MHPAWSAIRASVGRDQSSPASSSSVEAPTSETTRADRPPVLRLVTAVGATVTTLFVPLVVAIGSLLAGRRARRDGRDALEVVLRRWLIGGMVVGAAIIALCVRTRARPVVVIGWIYDVVVPLVLLVLVLRQQRAPAVA